MSATGAGAPDLLDLQEQIARIALAQEETRKFVSEQHKLLAEQSKLAAEAAKLDRDRRLSPWLAFVAIAGGVGGIIAGVQAVFRVIQTYH
jgi:ElaB/YqjD/DUF883 family membrane-anchored ribosome-binding protein